VEIHKRANRLWKEHVFHMNRQRQQQEEARKSLAAWVASKAAAAAAAAAAVAANNIPPVNAVVTARLDAQARHRRALQEAAATVVAKGFRGMQARRRCKRMRMLRRASDRAALLDRKHRAALFAQRHFRVSE
jgi:hypothetical protein